jgi:hypothetical protein
LAIVLVLEAFPRETAVPGTLPSDLENCPDLLGRPFSNGSSRGSISTWANYTG